MINYSYSGKKRAFARGRRNIGVFAALVLPLMGCDRRATISRERATQAPVGVTFPAGTVGAAVSEYTLTMAAVASWYSIVYAAGREADRSRQSVKLDFPLNSQLDAEAARVDSSAPIHAVLRQRGMSAEDFVVLTTAVGIVRMSLAIMDSLGPPGQPVNVSPSAINFARLHRRELDSLEAFLRQ